MGAKKKRNTTHGEIKGFMRVTPIKLCQQTLRKQSLFRRPQLPQRLAHVCLPAPEPLAGDELPGEQSDQKCINEELAQAQQPHLTHRRRVSWVGLGGGRIGIAARYGGLAGVFAFEPCGMKPCLFVTVCFVP